MPLYPASTPAKRTAKPPVTLLVMSVGENIFFDPTKEELAVADSVLAISVGHAVGTGELRLLAMRTIDPPSRLTTPGVPNSMNSATGGAVPASKEEAIATRESSDPQSVWRPPRGGVKRAVVSTMIKMVVQRGGVGEEVMEGLQGVET